MKNLLHKFFLLSLFLLHLVFESEATIHYVPADYATIQSAINVSANGDTVLVAPGIYFENINFKGKNIIVTSNFYLDNDTSFICQTIIDGSEPVNADTGSCVIFSSGEDSTAVLMGFTLTGGTGSKWLDAHGAGTYREGGGVLIDFSSPTIRNNKIIYNVATNSTGIAGAGGGGIRISDGNPYILNNLIAYNQGKYGPGVVLNWTGCVMRNNIICYNSGGQTFNGGGAIWSNTNSALHPKVIDNNTIYKNEATVGTGGCLAWSGTLLLKNNIIRGNTSPDNSQLKAIGGSILVTYSNVEGGYAGAGNLDVNPGFTDTLSFILNTTSPCVDAGDSSNNYNDVEDASNPGSAKFPSRGTTRNDMGAYGGQGASLISPLVILTGISHVIKNNFSWNVFPNPGDGEFSVNYFLPLSAFVELSILDQDGRRVRMLFSENQPEGSHVFIFPEKLQPGNYLLQLKMNEKVFSKIVVIP